MDTLTSITGGKEQEEQVRTPVMEIRETVMEAVGSGEFSTPTGKRKRHQSIAGESPEEATGRIHADAERGRAQKHLWAEIVEAVGDLREYVKNDFNKANKETRGRYFERRFALIEENAKMMQVEHGRAWELVDRIGGIERSMARIERGEVGGDFCRDIEAEVLRATTVMEHQTKNVLDEALGKMSRKVEDFLNMVQHTEEERERAMREEEAKRKRKSEEVWSLVSGLEKRMESVEKFMRDVIQNMGKTYVEVQQVGKSVMDDLKGIADTERRTEGQVGRLAEGLDVERISRGVLETKKMIEEAVGAISSVTSRVERMDVDGGDEAGASFAQVVRRRRKPKGPVVVLEGPAEEGRPQVTREQVIKCLDPKKGDVRVKGLRKQGRDFVVELHDEEDVNKLRQNVALEQIGVKVDGAATLKWPRVVVHDVEREIDREELLEAIWRRNAELLCGIEEERARQEFIPEFVRGRRDAPMRSWIVRVSPEIYKRLMRTERVYIGVRSCRVIEFNSVTRCYRCQGLGHIRKYCRDQERCGYCAGQHDLMRCDKKESAPTCVNCQRMGLRERTHMANWRDCPALNVFRRRVENMTDYGS